jgi:Plasmid maintenance system antidote protein
VLEECLKHGHHPYLLARQMGVPQHRIGEIVAGKRAVTADNGLRLAQFSGTSGMFLDRVRVDHDRATTRDAHEAILGRYTPWRERHPAYALHATRRGRVVL